MKQRVLDIFTIIGGLAAIWFFWEKCDQHNYCFPIAFILIILAMGIWAWHRWHNRPTKRKTTDNSEGPLALDSPLYVERPPIESDCYENITHPDALIRIKAPRQMGKSSLLVRILDHAKQQNCRTIYLSFQEADNEIFKSLDEFLKWFCGSVTEQLDLPNQLSENWQGVLGSKSKCNNYFEKFLLAEITEPLVLGLDEVDKIFEHQAIATDFFALLRVWHEKGKNDDPWKMLRMVITHSQEVYVPLKMDQSPFNVGISVDLPEFTQEQVQDLARRYQPAFTEEEMEQLVQLVGGHPYLAQVALYHISHNRLTLKRIVKTGPYEDGPYADHLRRHRLNLEKHPELVNEVKMVMSANHPLPVKEVHEVFQLRSMGLIKIKDNKVMPLCDLYRRYFNERL